MKIPTLFLSYLASITLYSLFVVWLMCRCPVPW